MPPQIPTVSAFERTNFFYGLLMDAERFQKDHAFFNGKRWLLNRLIAGYGVLCGLDVRLLPGSPKTWLIDPGIAIDAQGREIVVADSQAFNPFQVTDGQGLPSGPPLTAGTVEICLAYCELRTDPVPVLIPDCDGMGECAPSTIREGFVVIVRAASPAAPPAGGPAPGFPATPPLHDQLAKTINEACPLPQPDCCVPLARIDLGAGTIDSTSGRPLVYSNTLLFDLISSLGQQVGSAGNRILRYVAGDAQTGKKDMALVKPLTIELVDAHNSPVVGETVQFAAPAGSGSVASGAVVTAANGRASTTWTLGSTVGDQEVTASTSSTMFTVTFHATSI